MILRCLCFHPSNFYSTRIFRLITKKLTLFSYFPLSLCSTVPPSFNCGSCNNIPLIIWCWRRLQEYKEHMLFVESKSCHFEYYDRQHSFKLRRYTLISCEEYNWYTNTKKENKYGATWLCRRKLKNTEGEENWDSGDDGTAQCYSISPVPKQAPGCLVSVSKS